MTTHTQHSYGALEKGDLPPRSRTPGADDGDPLLGNPVNAARLRRAIDDSRAGRNMIPVTIEDLEALLHRGET